MKSTKQFNRNLISFGIPFGLFAGIIFLLKSYFLAGNDVLSLAITADLLLTVPLIYFLLIRKSPIPNTTVIPVMIIGLLIGSFLLPMESQSYLDLFKNWALPVIEISILIMVVMKVRKAIKTYQDRKSESPDFYDTLKNVCAEILPNKLAIAMATELAVFYYGFINWKRRKITNDEFTYHKKSGTPALFGGIIMVIGVETLALHFLLAKWSPIFAWILTGLSVYAAIQVLGFAKALSQRPISIDNKRLILRYGIMNEAQIPLQDIDSVALTRKRPQKSALTWTLSPLGELESQNVLIHLKAENTLIGLYGFKKQFLTIGLHVDEPQVFKEKLEKAIQQAEL